MSRQLPEKPNLQYLRKQAKELLRSRQQGKLADAQLALSKEYGFHSWAELKAHVQALTLSPAESLKAAVCDNDAARVRERDDDIPMTAAAEDKIRRRQALEEAAKVRAIYEEMVLKKTPEAVVQIGSVQAIKSATGPSLVGIAPIDSKGNNVNGHSNGNAKHEEEVAAPAGD